MKISSVGGSALTVALYLLVSADFGQATAEGSLEKRARKKYEGLNFLQCDNTKLPKVRPPSWPLTYFPEKHTSLLSFCAASADLIRNVGCFCRTPEDTMTCAKKFAHPKLKDEIFSQYCHQHCRCAPLDEDQEMEMAEADHISLEDLEEELNELSMDTGTGTGTGTDTIGPPVSEADNPDDPDWTLIDFEEDFTSNPNHPVHSSPDAISAAIASAMGTSILNTGSCLAGASSPLDPICEDDLPVSTCSGSSCTNYYDCSNTASSSASVDPPPSNHGAQSSSCRCRVRRPSLDDASKADFFFVAKCGDRRGRRRRRRSDSSADHPTMLFEDDSLCLCNGTYASTACCDSRDGLIWEDTELKRSIRLYR